MNALAMWNDWAFQSAAERQAKKHKNRNQNVYKNETCVRHLWLPWLASGYFLPGSLIGAKCLQDLVVQQCPTYVMPSSGRSKAVSNQQRTHIVSTASSAVQETRSLLKHRTSARTGSKTVESLTKSSFQLLVKSSFQLIVIRLQECIAIYAQFLIFLTYYPQYMRSIHRLLAAFCLGWSSQVTLEHRKNHQAWPLSWLQNNCCAAAQQSR